MRKPFRWLNRGMILAPCYALVTSEKAFRGVLKRLEIPRGSWPSWLRDDQGACTHTFDRGESKALVCLVSIRADAEENHSRYDVLGLLVHEASHVWQKCESHHDLAGEVESEAYSLQAISSELFRSWDEQREPKKGEGWRNSRSTSPARRAARSARRARARARSRKRTTARARPRATSAAPTSTRRRSRRG